MDTYYLPTWAKALGWANIIPITLAFVCSLSVRQHFQTSSPLKPLGKLSSNFIWRFLRTRERKCVQMVLVTWQRWPPCPYMVKKTFKNLLLQNQKTDDLGTWYVALGVLAYQVCSNNDPRLTLTDLTSRSSLLPNAIKWDFFWKVDFLNTLKSQSYLYFIC